MKSFFNHTLLILTVLAICCLALIFRGQLLAGYERTQISIPAEKAPVQTVPVPASIRSNNRVESKTRSLPARPRNKAKDWKASSLSDFADAPPQIQARIKGNLQQEGQSQHRK